MEGLRRVLLRGEESRSREQQAMLTLNDRISALTDAVKSNQQVMQRLAETSGGGDEVARGHLRNIELLLMRISTDSEQGRTESTNELKNELRVLARTVASLFGGKI